MNSAMLMAKASSLLHHLAKSTDDPGKLLARVNDELCETVSHGMFITIVSGFIDMDGGIIRLSNAGHQPTLYLRDDGVFETIPASALPIGILPAVEFPVTEIPMQGGNLYLFTDGVTESQNESGKQLELEGLMNLIRSNAGQPPAAQLENIVSEIRNPGGSQRDDITMMVIDCRRR
jgi:sigma-B regulation protein RsbU (phosphoserine phosphatase)